ncbi:MAG: hypothetical protein JWM14_568 [Chitinophagaceae bacterium]|nr:hypothetical protein [Chitinophagaceae bacterium]
MKQFLLSLLIFSIIACSSDPEKKAELVEITDTVTAPKAIPEQQQPTEESEYSEKKSFIAYQGAVKDKYRTSLETFPAFEKLSSLSAAAIQLKDSIKYLRDVQEITDPNDKKIFIPAENRAYQAILAYQKALQDNPHVHDVSTKLIELTRIPDPNDSSFLVLPQVGKSTLLSQGNFFFLGGAPFITKLDADNKTVYTDANGNPQTRFLGDISENTSYILNSLLHFNNSPVKVTFGHPLSSYDIKKHEIHDIGFLKHEFVNPIPAFFLTEQGLVPAHVAAVDLKLIPQNLGCLSDQPYVTFTCSKYLNEKDILGIYIPYDSTPISSCVIKRYDDNRVWTIDLNNDGIPELACVSDTFTGISDDKMVEEIWFVNIDGAWKIIDWAAELDCT